MWRRFTLCIVYRKLKLAELHDGNDRVVLFRAPLYATRQSSSRRLSDYERCRLGVEASLSRNIELYAPPTGIHHRVTSRSRRRSLWDAGWCHRRAANLDFHHRHRVEVAGRLHRMMPMGDATGMAAMAMAIPLLGRLWPLMALAITLFALCCLV